MARRPAGTIMELCVARAGMLRGARVAAFIAQWTIVSQALDRPITLEDYGAWWHESERTVYRHQARFREVFPQLKTPQPISDAAIARAGEWRDRGVAGIGELPVSLAVA